MNGESNSTTVGYNGADVDQLRQAATQFERMASSVEATTRSLHNLVNNTGQWLGADGDRFRTAWNDRSARTLQTAAAALRQGAIDLRRNADEQERVSTAGAARAPTNSAQLFEHIKNSERDSDGVRIEKVLGADGATRLIVYFKGQDSTDNRTLLRNAPLLVGYVDADVTAKIDEALKACPDGTGTDVMLVGYSQGGLDAQNIAASGKYHVTTLVTYGSPLVQSDIPGVQAVHLRADGDAVPAVGGLAREVEDVVLTSGPATVIPTGNPLVQAVTHAVVDAVTGQAPSTANHFDADPGLADRSPLNVHSHGYPAVAHSFDNSTDPRWGPVKASMEKFQGVIVTAAD